MIELEEEKIWEIYKEWEKLMSNSPSGRIEAGALEWALQTLGFPVHRFVDAMKTARSHSKNYEPEVKIKKTKIHYQCCTCGFTFHKIGSFNRFSHIMCPRCKNDDIQIFKIETDRYILWERC
jgi:hypothetical protein